MMRKYLVSTLAASVLAAMAPSAQAAVATGTFNVAVNLTTSCTVNTGAGTNIAIAYSANQGGAATGTGGAYTVTCTNGVNYALGVDAGGTLLGIAYTLATDAGGTGTGLAVPHTVTASAAAGQNGTCTTATCTDSAVHTVTLTY